MSKFMIAILCAVCIQSATAKDFSDDKERVAEYKHTQPMLMLQTKSYGWLADQLGSLSIAIGTYGTINQFKTIVLKAKEDKAGIMIFCTPKTNAVLNKALSRIEDGYLNAMVFLYVGNKEECNAEPKELDRLGVDYAFLLPNVGS
jgi:hypothetical protein